MANESRPSSGEVTLGGWLVTREWVQSYLEAVDDSSGNYLELGLVPPLALTAHVLGRVLETLELPGGTIHSLQEMETLAPLRIGETVDGFARRDPPRRRGGLEFTTVSYTLAGPGGQPVQQGKTTVLTPAQEGSTADASLGDVQP